MTQEKAVQMDLDTLIAQQPAKLDRSRWEGCSFCTQVGCRDCFWGNIGTDKLRCDRCENFSEWEPQISYCPNCGRPLTEEAWTEMERRINSGTTD